MTEYTTDGSLMGDLRREACSGIAGCEQLVPEWNSGLINFRVDGGYEDTAEPVFYFVRDTPPSYGEIWVTAADGSGLLGFRSYRNVGVCRAVAFDFRLGRFALVVVEPDGLGDVDSWVLAGRLLGDQTVSIRNFGRLNEALPVPTSDFHRVRVGPSRFALESAAWHSILDVTWDGVATLVGDPSDGGETYLSSIVGDAVLYDVYGFDHVRVALAGGHGEVLIAPPSVAANAAVTDGVDLAWLQGYEGATPGVVERLELWASPFAQRAADLAPRKIGDVAGTDVSAGTVIGHGYVAVQEPAPTGLRAVTRVYRLSDGARATIAPPDGNRFRIPAVYIGAEVIALPLGLTGSPPEDQALMFIRLDSLDFVVP